MEDEAADPSRTARLDIGFTTALLVVLAVGAAILLINVFSAASQPLGWALACATVALLVQPVIGWLSRYMKRGFAVVITLFGIAVLLAGAWIGVANTVADNIATLRDQAPQAAAELEQDSGVARDFDLEARVTAFVEELDDELGGTAQLRRSTSTASTYVVTGVLTVFFIAYGDRLAAGALRQIRNDDRRATTQHVANRAVHRWRSYSLRAIAEAITVTVTAWLALYLIDVPAPFVLGLVLGGFAVIPYVGILIGGIPTLLFAAADGTASVLAVIVLVAALEVTHILAVRRRVNASGVYLGPALPLIVGLLGFQLYGLGGVIYGVLLLILAIAIADELATRRHEPTSAQLAAGTPARRTEPDVPGAT